MKRKVKKFGRGGDIVTGIGAALIGKALYDKYMGKDDSKATESSSRSEGSGASTPKPRISEEVEKAQKKSGTDSSRFTGEKEDRKEYVAADDEENKAKRTALAGGMSYTKPEASTAVDTSNKAAIDAINAAKDARARRKDAAAKAAADNAANASTTSSVLDAGIEAGKAKNAATAAATDKKPLPDSKEAKERARKKFLESQAGMKRTGITTPGTAKAGDKSGSTQKGRSENPIQGTIDNAGKSMARTPEQKMGERAREVQRRREEEMKSRYKKGGAVKKYASGGSVSSASKRADGIAMRGKTRGKVC